MSAVTSQGYSNSLSTQLLFTALDSHGDEGMTSLVHVVFLSLYSSLSREGNHAKNLMTPVYEDESIKLDLVLRLIGTTYPWISGC